MNVIKVTLGFLELVFALKFLSVADLAYGWRLLDRETFLALWIVIFALLGFYQYALSLTNALSADGITKPALPHLEKFHVMRLHPLGTYESYADMIVRIFRYRKSSAFAA